MAVRKYRSIRKGKVFYLEVIGTKKRRKKKKNSNKKQNSENIIDKAVGIIAKPLDMIKL